MKFTFWDQLVLNVTGRLPKKTQAEVDTLLETKALIAKVTEAESRARFEMAEKRRLAALESSKIDLVEPKKAPSKKKADSTKKKPSKG
jgi:hypothetical protein